MSLTVAHIGSHLRVILQISRATAQYDSEYTPFLNFDTHFMQALQDRPTKRICISQPSLYFLQFQLNEL